MDTIETSDFAIWNEICAAESRYTGDLCRLLHQITTKAQCLADALKNPVQRSSALRVLLVVQDVGLVKSVFSEILQLAAIGHKDIGLCRTVIKSLPLAWVRSNIWPALALNLSSFSFDSEVEEEAYRRYAELLEELDPDLLRKHVEVALGHSNGCVREVGVEFAEKQQNS